VLRVFRVKKLLLRYQETLRPVINAMRVSLQLVTIFLISHLMACLWYMAGKSIYSVQCQYYTTIDETLCSCHAKFNFPAVSDPNRAVLRRGWNSATTSSLN
jgi:hypothetical protein